MEVSLRDIVPAEESKKDPISNAVALMSVSDVVTGSAFPADVTGFATSYGKT